MKYIIDLISNIINISALAIVIQASLMRFFTWATDKRYLHAILSSRNKQFLVTQALFGPGMIASSFTLDYILLTENSVIALHKVTKTLEKNKIRYDLFNTSTQYYDEIHLGGPISNIHTNAYIEQFFPDFHFCDYLAKQENHENYYKIHKSIIEYSDNFHGFIINKVINNQPQRILFPTDKESDYMFLIKLTSEDLGCSKTVHLVFGGSDVGSLVAADFFARHYKKIYSKQKDKHYFLAIPVHRTNQSAAISMIQDLTEVMFSQ